MEHRHRIFVSAYACAPGMGSETGVGWHWVLEMSKYFELWVLTRNSKQQSIDSWIEQHPEYGGIHFLYYDLPDWVRFWKKDLRADARTYYILWQFSTNRIVKRVMKEHDIHIFHHLTFGNVLWNVSSYGQKQFFIWGPVGGVETIPEEYSCHYPRKMRIVEAVRRFIASNLRFNSGFKHRCKNANLVLCKTDILRQNIPQCYRDKAILFTDVAVDDVQLRVSEDEKKSSKQVKFIMVGRLSPWRGFDLAIEAFFRALKVNSNMRMTIIGKGDDKERLEKLISQLQLADKVTLTGEVTMERYKEYLRDCDVVVNTSLKEGAVTVSFDSMAMGKPLICIDTTGYTRYFSPEYSEVIQLSDRNTTIEAVAKSMVRLSDSSIRYEMGRKAQQAGRQFSWKNRGKEIYEIIARALKDTDLP